MRLLLAFKADFGDAAGEEAAAGIQGRPRRIRQRPRWRLQGRLRRCCRRGGRCWHSRPTSTTPAATPLAASRPTSAMLQPRRLLLAFKADFGDAADEEAAACFKADLDESGSDPGGGFKADFGDAAGEEAAAGIRGRPRRLRQRPRWRLQGRLRRGCRRGGRCWHSRPTSTNPAATRVGFKADFGDAAGEEAAAGIRGRPRREMLTSLSISPYGHVLN